MTGHVDPYAILDRDFDSHEGPSPSSPTASNLGRKLMSWGARAIDRGVLEGMRFLFMRDAARLDDIAEAMREGRETYGTRFALPSPESFYRPVAAPDDVDVELLERFDGGERLDVRFESPYRVFDADYAPTYRQWHRNRTCHVRLWTGERHRGPSARPLVVCLHCWAGGRLWFEERMFAARRLHREGFDVALVTLPFHGSRAPREAVMSGEHFPSYHLRRTNEAFGQAVADVRALVAWLQSIGRGGHFGVVGFSLGGYLASLLASIEPRVSFVVPMFAPASFADVLWWHGRGRPRWRHAVESGATLEHLRDVWAVHSPLSYRPEVPTSRRLIIAAEGDGVVRPAQIRALDRHWGEGDDVRWFQGGHVAHWDRAAYVETLVDWLSRLEFAD